MTYETENSAEAISAIVTVGGKKAQAQSHIVNSIKPNSNSYNPHQIHLSYKWIPGT
jgi:hypothetical protein